jgi:hypothetical protein
LFCFFLPPANAQALPAAGYKITVARHIFGVEPVPIEKCLSEAGFDSKITDGELVIAGKPGLSGATGSVLNGVPGR